jgi:hypothetical protein
VEGRRPERKHNEIADTNPEWDPEARTGLSVEKQEKKLALSL